MKPKLSMTDHEMFALLKKDKITYTIDRRGVTRANCERCTRSWRVKLPINGKLECPRCHFKARAEREG